MFIILVAHIPYNAWANWIPARFGFSDATEIFVFCSGMASAIAFGAVFDRRGWLLGAVRVAYRVWQVYWAHIGVFFVTATLLAAIDATGAFERSYVGDLNLTPFFEHTKMNLVGLMTLTYVPNYFDILPMYLVILAMMPFIVALSRVHLGLVLLAVLAMWLAANHDLVRLPAEPWSDREWFFNPFGWQLIFFTGFAFMRGWIPAPPVRVWMLVAAAVIIVATIPFAWGRLYSQFGPLGDARAATEFLHEKTEFGLFRYIHFLSIAYIAWVAVGPMGSRLSVGTWWPNVVAVIRKVGQQSLAVFVTSLVVARLLGVVLDVFDHALWAVLMVNFVGFAIIIATAYFVGWIKGHPWRKPAPVQQSKSSDISLNNRSERAIP
jgi:hypothetical protein